jgi:hypothetical protein
MSAIARLPVMVVREKLVWRNMQPCPELATIRHRTASGLIDCFWEFLPKGGFPDKPNRIFASIRLGSARAVEVEIPICSNRSSKEEMRGKWVLVRKGEHHWLLSAARMPLDFQRIAHSEAFHPDLPVGSLVLSDAPSHVSDELAAI